MIKLMKGLEASNRKLQSTNNTLMEPAVSKKLKRRRSCNK